MDLGLAVRRLPPALPRQLNHVLGIEEHTLSTDLGGVLEHRPKHQECIPAEGLLHLLRRHRVLGSLVNVAISILVDGILLSLLLLILVYWDFKALRDFMDIGLLGPNHAH